MATKKPKEKSKPLDLSDGLAFKTDPEWHEIGLPGFGNVEFLIAPLQNELHEEKLKKLTKPYKKQIKRGTLPENKNKSLGAQSMGGTVLCGWRSKNGKGEPLYDAGKPYPYSQVNAENLLMRSDIFLEEIATIANEMRTEKKTEEEAQDEEDLGKL